MALGGLSSSEAPAGFPHSLFWITAPPPKIFIAPTQYRQLRRLRGLCGRESSWRYSKTNSGSSLTSFFFFFFFFFFFDFFSYGSPSAQLDTDMMIGGGKTRRQLLAQYHLPRKNFHAFRLFFNLRKSSRFPTGVPNSLPHVNAELIKIKHNWQYCKLIDL